MHDDLDALMSEEFLNSLDTEDNRQKEDDKPFWVKENKHTTYRAWLVILELQEEKKRSIHTFGKVADAKTPKSLYEIKKSEVARLVGLSAQSIFRKSSFSKDIRTFFNVINDDLLVLHEKEQSKQKLRRKNTGVRANKKEVLVSEVQDLRNIVKELECRQVKDTLDLVLTKMPLDLRQKLRM